MADQFATECGVTDPSADLRVTDSSADPRVAHPCADSAPAQACPVLNSTYVTRPARDYLVTPGGDDVSAQRISDSVNETPMCPELPPAAGHLLPHITGVKPLLATPLMGADDSISNMFDKLLLGSVKGAGGDTASPLLPPYVSRQKGKAVRRADALTNSPSLVSEGPPVSATDSEVGTREVPVEAMVRTVSAPTLPECSTADSLWVPRPAEEESPTAAALDGEVSTSPALSQTLHIVEICLQRSRRRSAALTSGASANEGSDIQSQLQMILAQQQALEQQRVDLQNKLLALRVSPKIPASLCSTDMLTQQVERDPCKLFSAMSASDVTIVSGQAGEHGPVEDTFENGDEFSFTLPSVGSVSRRQGGLRAISTGYTETNPQIRSRVGRESINLLAFSPTLIDIREQTSEKSNTNSESSNASQNYAETSSASGYRNAGNISIASQSSNAGNINDLSHSSNARDMSNASHPGDSRDIGNTFQSNRNGNISNASHSSNTSELNGNCLSHFGNAKDMSNAYHSSNAGNISGSSHSGDSEHISVNPENSVTFFQTQCRSTLPNSSREISCTSSSPHKSALTLPNSITNGRISSPPTPSNTIPINVQALQLSARVGQSPFSTVVPRNYRLTLADSGLQCMEPVMPLIQPVLSLIEPVLPLIELFPDTVSVHSEVNTSTVTTSSIIAPAVNCRELTPSIRSESDVRHLNGELSRLSSPIITPSVRPDITTSVRPDLTDKTMKLGAHLELHVPSLYTPEFPSTIRSHAQSSSGSNGTPDLFKRFMSKTTPPNATYGAQGKPYYHLPRMNMIYDLPTTPY